MDSNLNPLEEGREQTKPQLAAEAGRTGSVTVTYCVCSESQTEGHRVSGPKGNDRCSRRKVCVRTLIPTY